MTKKDLIPRGVTKLTGRPQKMFRGKLIEEYDGIGLYCQVAVSDGSTSGVYSARVGAGDFGGGRVFPVGTDVITFIHNGKLEVLTLGNLPGCKCLEDFLEDRTSGWGQQGFPFLWDFYGDGGSVADQRASDYFVSDSSGIIKLINTAFDTGDRYIAMRGRFTYPIELLFKITIVTPTTPYDEYIGPIRVYFTRSTGPTVAGDNQQYAQIDSETINATTLRLNHGVTTGGGAEISHKDTSGLLPGFNNTPFYWRIQASPTEIHHRAWFVGEDEPTDWQSEEIRDDNPTLRDPLYIGIYSPYVYIPSATDTSIFRLEIDSICSSEPTETVASIPILAPGVLFQLDGMPQFSIDHYADASKRVHSWLGNAPGQVYSDPHFIDAQQTAWWAVSDSTAGDGTGIWLTNDYFNSVDLEIPPEGLKLYYYGYYYTDGSGGTMYSTGATHLKIASSPIPLTIEQVHVSPSSCGNFQTLCAGTFIVRPA